MSAETATGRRPLGQRYRRWYESLPVGAQMVGLQLWFPTFFVFGFVLCFLFGFHAPAFKDVPIVVVGSSATATPVIDELEAASDGGVQGGHVADRATAEREVRAGTYTAAYVPGDGTATLVVASAGGYQLASYAENFFRSAAQSANVDLTVDDLAPLPPSDSFGMSLFYLGMTCTVPAFMVSMFVGMMGAGLRHRWRFGIFGVTSVVLPGLAVLLGEFVVRAFSGNFFLLWAIGAATSFAIGCVVSAIGYFAGHYVIGWALALFMFLNVPSSGGAYPPQLVPQPFRFLHDYVTLAATTNLFRHAVYGVGPAPWRGWLLLAAYAAVGIALAVIGKRYHRWRNDRRSARSARPSMMMTAQIAALVSAGHVVEASEAHGRHLGAADARSTAEERQAAEQIVLHEDQAAGDEAGSDAGAAAAAAAAGGSV